MNAIELDRVTLARGDRIVVSDLSASIRSGEFIGIFGPNGAGKTTLLQAMLGLLRPAAGAIRIFGAVAVRGNRDAGYLPQHPSQIGDLRMRGRDFVASALHGERWGLPRLGRAGAAEVDRVIGLVDATALAPRPFFSLSGGERQRLLLAQALLGEPRLLLLDEPFISLDPHFKHAVVELIVRLRRKLGITVLLTAHELNPLLGAIDRVLYLGGGRAAIGTVQEVMTSEVLSRLYGMDIEVLRVKDRIVVLSGHGLVEAEAHDHHQDA